MRKVFVNFVRGVTNVMKLFNFVNILAECYLAVIRHRLAIYYLAVVEMHSHIHSVDVETYLLVCDQVKANLNSP